MHVACLTKAYAHPNEPCYLNTLYVPEVCRVHRARKLGDNDKHDTFEQGTNVC